MKWAALLTFGLIGLLCLIGGLFWGGSRSVVYATGTRTMGAVVDFSTSSSLSSDGRSVTSYHPVVEFETEGGTVTIVGSTGQGNRPGYALGQTLAVVYDPRKPHEAVVDDFWQAWAGPLFLAVFGAVFGFFGFLAFRLLSRFRL